KPEAVLDYVKQRFTEYIAKHPEEVRMADPADPRIMRPPLAPARDAAEWIARRMSDTEQLLWSKSCRKCHPASTPRGIPDAAITPRWMKRARFDHDAHQMVTCTECHAQATLSNETSDVLLPGIDTCRRCHQSGGAEWRCFECHVYHDWSKKKRAEDQSIND